MRARWAALGLLACAAGACGGSPSKQCMTFDVQQLDEQAVCLGPPVVAQGLLICHDPNEPQGHGLVPSCFVDSSGNIFRGLVGVTAWIEPFSTPGWTHSDLLMAPSTLSPADQARCAPALMVSTATCQ